MNDFLAAIADHLNRTPSMCRCGHPSVLHAEGVGCLGRFEHDSGVDLCPCALDLNAAQWEADHPGGVISDEELASMDAYGSQEHDSGSDVCPCEEGR